MSRLARGARFLAPALQALLGLFGTAPLWTVALARIRSLRVVVAPLDCWFRRQCAREPARALELFGSTLPVCARCCGIYFGLAAGALIVRPRLSAASLRIWLLTASALMMLDVLSEAWAVRPPSASLRFATGCSLAYPVGVALVLWLRDRTRGPAKAGSRNRCSAPSTSG